MKTRGVTTNCPVCGKSFYRYPSQIKRGICITCSRTCAARHFRDKGEMTKCVTCGKDFWRTAWAKERGFGTTCSRKCHVATRIKTVTRDCMMCGKEFSCAHYQATVNKGGKFCSKACLYKFRRKLRKRSEQELFTNWQKREWMGTFCAHCHSTEKLELDHIIPRFAGGKATKENAQTLCRLCNRKKFWTIDHPLWLSLLKQRAQRAES